MFSLVKSTCVRVYLRRRILYVTFVFLTFFCCPCLSFTAHYMALIRTFEKTDPVSCILGHLIMCICVCFREKEVSQMARQYQEMEKELIFSGRYDNNDNFTVVIQPFTVTATENDAKALIPDRTYLAPDCSHYNLKGHALAAQYLWNNMLQPVGRKTINFEPSLFPDLKCPTEDAPFFFTNKNSKIYLKTGRQW